MQKNNTYTMEELVPVMSSFFEEDKKVIITAVGNSMRPIIRHQKDGIILEKYKGQELNIGDMIFYKRDNGFYVLHRIIEIADDGSFTMCGDNQLIKENGIRPGQVIAVPTAVIRGKKTISVKSKGYCRYKKIWIESVFFRKLCIKLFRVKIKLSGLLKR